MTNLVPRVEFALQSLYKRASACPYCRSRETEVVARKHLVVRVRRCSACTLAFTDPVYEPALGGLYDRLYEGEGSTTSVPEGEELERLRASRFAGTDKDFADRIARLARVAPGERLLELGSSWGYFVFQARAAGFDATGVEIGDRRRELGARALGVPLVASLAELAERRFDLVYTSHVLEHFTDLSTIFDELWARLAPGGLLAIEVPHFDLERRPDDALAIVGAVHPLGFPSDFFARNLPRHGFEIEGFFDAWEDVPDRPRPSSVGDVVIVLARRPGTEG